VTQEEQENTQLSNELRQKLLIKNEEIALERDKVKVLTTQLEELQSAMADELKKKEDELENMRIQLLKAKTDRKTESETLHMIKTHERSLHAKVIEKGAEDAESQLLTKKKAHVANSPCQVKKVAARKDHKTIDDPVAPQKKKMSSEKKCALLSCSKVFNGHALYFYCSTECQKKNKLEKQKKRRQPDVQKSTVDTTVEEFNKVLELEPTCIA
jgi:hypothetical protein